MTLAKPTDGRVARHRSRIVSTHGDQRDLYTHPGGRSGSFQAGVPRTYDQHIIMFHVKHLLADAEAGEDLIKVVIRRNASNHFTQAMRCGPNCFSQHLGRLIRMHVQNFCGIL